MRPVLFSLFGLDIQTYGVSKVLAAWVGALLLGRAFTARGLARELAYPLVLWSTVWGFVGAKVYYLLEQLPHLSVHDFSGMGFTWYGGLLAGTVAALVMVKRSGLPLGTVAGAIAAPLSVAYAIGRLGCLISGDGTYGRPTSLPWGMRFPDGVVASDVAVHPTPLYEALAALLIAAVLWRLGRHVPGPAVFGWYLLLSGVARFLVEFLRTNPAAVLGLTQPQVWAAVSVLVGVALIARHNRSSGCAAQQLSTTPPPSPSATLSLSCPPAPAGRLDRTP